MDTPIEKETIEITVDEVHLTQNCFFDKVIDRGKDTLSTGIIQNGLLNKPVFARIESAPKNEGE